MKTHGVTLDERRQQQPPVEAYFHGKRRFFDRQEQVTVVKIFSGQWHVSSSPHEMLATILGSCVSVCMRDPVIGVGGMNHFLLPGAGGGDQGVSARYGIYAMECLINGVLAEGGCKDRLEVKVFGGGNVIARSSPIGSMNARFIREFLRTEGFRIASEDLEGTLPRRLHYYPHSGKVMMRLLRRKEDMAVIAEEERYAKQIETHPVEGSVELF